MHPGDLLRDELVARNIKHYELADVLGIARSVMSEIIHGKRKITPALAVKLENALGIKAEFWMKHQVIFDIDKIRLKNNTGVGKKAGESARR